MARFTQIDPETATGKVKDLFAALKRKLGMVPNISRALANSPAALEGYLTLSGTLGGGSLSAQDRERIALAVGQANGCDYCLAAHTALGKMVGLTADQIRESRVGTAADPKTDALTRFTRRVLATRGHVTDAEVAAARAAGYTDGDLTEVVANVALNVLTNYFNHVADTDLDFPKAETVVDHHDECATIPGCDPTR
ncbi:peroxidase-related enzyme : Uncharacterized peroxidase-related enzyme OS=Pirellula staleyi (strain ATCC 27377 / DSM 6068 / ICPB 4128) GN=Psta_0275 PE=4 SV=1: CMD [Gemmataceae bacterium]|nr:peroxidase-related enzyme : Uncharacterized peroxidase-related enzyme OS=Pirellula staleyi (strain ATCC 27377 / DSM 6068 / ICPB 4128) GN=Psta_0275 PE=4 SV=1: CMD [Gemmataceae bacterium]VTT99526.1 peroxidase-related enzyme : Uncharacterized peroxidase-related enzyme OS=Pirellula staleyi (strain ATCC 27377 / DSM 6068 / ICPB 4128) GN=Psta_0275 PE=4 SV=1: CMD [Gemmataceae bacterium]